MSNIIKVKAFAYTNQTCYNLKHVFRYIDINRNMYERNRTINLM